MWLQYALDKNNRLVSVHDVERGKSNIKCPYCKGALTAKKGRIKAHHFAHVADTCDFSRNRDVNLPFFYGFNLVLQKKYLEHFKRITSPDYKGINSFQNYRSISEEKRIHYYLENKEVLKYSSNKATSLGKIILKQLSLKEFCTVQEKSSQERLIELQNNLIRLEKSIEQTIEFQKTDYYLSKPVRYKRVVNKNQKQSEFQLQQSLVNFDIYCAQYRRVLHHHLYLLEITVQDKTFHKIGVTRRDIKERIQEIQKDLSKRFSDFSVSLLGLWLNRGNLEYYFKYVYSEFNYCLGSLTEYFDFPDIEPILRDLNGLEVKQLDKIEQSIFNDLTANNFLRSEHIRQGMQKSRQNGIHIGRPKDEIESTRKFLAKPKNKAIATVLKKGLSLRQTAKKVGVSVNTVRKVKAALEQSAFE